MVAVQGHYYVYFWSNIKKDQGSHLPKISTLIFYFQEASFNILLEGIVTCFIVKNLGMTEL